MTVDFKTAQNTMHPRIRDYHAGDWPAVEAVYQAGIDTGLATLETSPKSQESFEMESINDSLIVAELDDKLFGWAGLWPISKRTCYRGVGEVSVYVDPTASGCGVGSALLAALSERAETLGIWTLQAAILADNKRSVEVHKRAGFRIVGRREALGERGGRWHDIILMDKRSSTLGVNADAQRLHP